MGPKYRIFATLIVWGFAAIAVSVGMRMPVPAGLEIPILAILTLAGLICMGFIWNWGRLPLSVDMPMQSGKAKRSASSKAALLRELLDDEELDAVKARLMTDISGNHYDDGELPLEALLEQDEV